MYGSRIMSKKDGQRCVEDSIKLLEIFGSERSSPKEI